MEKGTVKTLMSEKGYGFISRDGQEKDLFFHVNQTQDFDGLHVGDEVVFDVEQGPKGLNAVNVRKA